MTKKKIFVVGSSVIGVMFASMTVALAQTGIAPSATAEVKVEAKAQAQKDFQEKVKDAKTEMQTNRINVINTIKDARTDAKADVKTFRTDMKAAIKIERDNFNKDLQAKKAELKNATTTAQRAEIKAEIEAELSNMKQSVELKRQEMQLEIKAKVASTTATIALKVSELKAGVAKKRGEVIQAYFERAAALFNDRINKIETLTNSTEEKVVKLEANGANLTQAHTLIAETRTEIATAQTKISALNDLAVVAVGASASIDTKPTISTSASDALKVARKDVEDAINSAHKSLTNIIKLIAPVKSVGASATVTTSVTSATTTTTQ
ncbi:MAG: hypothetical protein PHS95_02250 [Candidatus Pacebacteria bacterium]|nr:hypothetical protein [Candidatus Paceibacterota bacterium]